MTQCHQPCHMASQQNQIYSPPEYQNTMPNESIFILFEKIVLHRTKHAKPVVDVYMRILPIKKWAPYWQSNAAKQSQQFSTIFISSIIYFQPPIPQKINPSYPNALEGKRKMQKPRQTQSAPMPLASPKKSPLQSKTLSQPQT